jgi:hypothetical protein
VNEPLNEAEKFVSQPSNKIEILQNLARVIIFLWFLVISVFILITSYKQLNLAQAAEEDARTQITKISPPPKIPDDPKTFDGTFEQQVAVYNTRAAAYEKAVVAYSKYIEERTKAINRTAAYSAVVKDVLVSMLSGLATALLGFVFANVGAQVANNYLLTKQGTTPQPVRLFS